MRSGVSGAPGTEPRNPVVAATETGEPSVGLTSSFRRVSTAWIRTWAAPAGDSGVEEVPCRRQQLEW
jgi:hypothetical protein